MGETDDPTDVKHRLPVLTSDNWREWSGRIETVLASKDVWNTVELTEYPVTNKIQRLRDRTRHPQTSSASDEDKRERRQDLDDLDDATEKAQKDWRNDHSTALATIKATISKPLQEHARGLKDARVVWEKLRHACVETANPDRKPIKQMVNFAWLPGERPADAGARITALLADILAADQHAPPILPTR